jgi:hypothetical protein
MMSATSSAGRTRADLLLFRLRGRERKQIQGAGGGADGSSRKTKVAGCGGQAVVTQQKLNSAQVGPGLQQVDRVGVAQGLLILLMICA